MINESVREQSRIRIETDEIYEFISDWWMGRLFVIANWSLRIEVISLSEFFKWLIVGWSIVVVGIAALGMILIVKYGEVKKIETDDVSLCFIICFFCWLIRIVAFTILARTLGFWLGIQPPNFFIL